MQSDMFVLKDRGVIALGGADAQPWLDNLITNDLALLDKQPAVFAGLLSPQGKLLFEFFVIRHGAELLIETHATSVAALIKRLTLYKLRAQITLRDETAEWVPVWAPVAPAPAPGVIVYADPRAPERLWRGLRPAGHAAQHTSNAYAAARVAHGVAEAPDDYALGDTFPHEANFDVRAGVSFTKGCFVGQEVVARMQNKSVVRKRVVRITADTALATGADITVGTAIIGRVGSVVDNAGLAMLRLDRAVEALSKGETVVSGAVALTIDSAALANYRNAVAHRPEIDL
jgi:tRNA-modifying protein YgfZ